MSNTETWNANGVTIKANGENVGTATAAETLSAVVNRFAVQKGIRQFTVFAGDRKLYTTDGAKTLQDLEATELNIVTKDQRAIWFV